MAMMEVVIMAAPDVVVVVVAAVATVMVLAAGTVAPRDLAVLTDAMLLFKLAAVTSEVLARKVLVKVTVAARRAAAEVTV